MKQTPWNVIFMGTPQFSVPALKALLKKERVIGVYTQPDRPQGRGQRTSHSPIKALALTHNIPCFQPEKLDPKKEEDRLKQLNPHLIVVVAYGLFLPKEILSIPKFQTINIHPSLLPMYRGAAPIQWALINGDTQTGVSIVYVTPKMDAGDILIQQKTAIKSSDTAASLEEQLSAVGAKLMMKAIENLKEGKAGATPQDPKQVTLAPKLDKSISKIDWTQAATSIVNLVRGANPWPGTYFEFNGENIKVHNAHVASPNEPGRPGLIRSITKEGILIETRSGFIYLTELQRANKNRMPAKDFIKGFLELKEGALLL